MIKPEDIIIETERVNLSNDKRYPDWRTTVRASIQVSEQLMVDPRLEGRCDSRILEEVKAKLRRAVWDRIYEPGVFRDRVHEAIESGRQESYGSGCLSRAGEETYRQGLISLLSYLDMPRTLLMDNGSSIKIESHDDPIRGGPNLMADLPPQ